MEIRTATIFRLRDALLSSGSKKSPVTTSAYRALVERSLFTEAELRAIERVGPFAESMFVVIAADNKVTDSELTALRGAVRGLTGDVLSNEILVMLMDKYARLLQSEGLQKRLQAIAGMLDEEEIQNAFALAAAVSLADGQLVEEEDSVIHKMRAAFGLSDTQVDNILGALHGDSAR